jgi:hypothetical protein
LQGRIFSVDNLVRAMIISGRFPEWTRLFPLSVSGWVMSVHALAVMAFCLLGALRNFA